jgi:hypothetical protein
MLRRTIGAGIAAQVILIGTVRADLPLVAGNFSIAQKFFHGDAHLVMLGDSEQNGIVGLYPSTWTIDKWAGMVTGDNLGATFNGDTGAFNFGFTQPFIASQTGELADTTNPLVAGQVPGATHVINFASQPASTGGNLLSNRVLETDLEPNQQNIFHGGSWDDLSTGTMHADAILYANPTGIPSGLQYVIRGTSTDTPVASAMVNTQSSTKGLIQIPLSFPSQSSFRSSGISGSFRMADGVTPAEGSNFVLSGVHYYNGQPGFQLANLAWGGKDIEYFIKGADQHLDQFFQMTDTNMAYIWIGQNNPQGYTGAQFKARMQLLISKYKAIRPDMQFVLVSTYDTGGAVQSDFAQAEYDISQSDPSVLFLNLYKSAGSFSFLDANYLSDHIHPNIPGDTYFANQVQSLLAMADAQAPKLPGDANLDRIVNSQDFVAMASHFGNQSAYLAIGDFNGDRIVNALDFNILATHFGQTLPAGTTLAPEPAMTVMLLALLATRRRRA